MFKFFAGLNIIIPVLNLIISNCDLYFILKNKRNERMKEVAKVQ